MAIGKPKTETLFRSTEASLEDMRKKRPGCKRFLRSVAPMAQDSVKILKTCSINLNHLQTVSSHVCPHLSSKIVIQRLSDMLLKVVMCRSHSFRTTADHSHCAAPRTSDALRSELC